MTLGSTTSDDRWLLVSSTRNDVAWVYEADEAEAGVAGFFRQAPVPSQPLTPSQREAGDFYPFGGCDIVPVSEHERIWLLRNR